MSHYYYIRLNGKMILEIVIFFEEVWKLQIRCEKCSAVSDAAMPETYLEGDVELTFLRCPSCGEVYPVCATDSRLREDIAEYKEMRSLIRHRLVGDSFLRKAEALKQKNMQRSRELMERHPLASFFQPIAAE